eukprot:15167_1
MIELEERRQQKIIVVNANAPIELERVKTQSHVSVRDDDDPPTPVSDEQMIELEDAAYDKPQKPVHLPSGSLQTIANKRLSRSRSGNKSGKALIDLIPLKDEVESDEDKKNDNLQSIEAQFKALSDRNLNSAMLNQFDDISDDDSVDDIQNKVKIEPKTKHEAVQSGDDLILDIFSANNEAQPLEESVSVSQKEKLEVEA